MCVLCWRVGDVKRRDWMEQGTFLLVVIRMTPIGGTCVEVKERVEYGHRGDDRGRYPPLPSRRSGEVGRIRAMYGRRPIGWSPLFVHVLTAYHQEVQRCEEGCEK